MNELTLTYPTLLETAMVSADEAFVNIRKKIDHYKRLNMPSAAIEMAKLGAVSTLLKMHGLKMLFIKDYDDGDFALYGINGEGEREGALSWDNGKRDTFYWNRSKLNRYKGSIPLEVLEKLPDTASDDAWVFYAEKDPILAYPLCFTEEKKYIKKQIETTGIDRFLGRHKFIKAEKSIKVPDKYFAGIFRW